MSAENRQSTRQAHGRLADWFRELRMPLRRFIAKRQGVGAADLDDVAQEVFLRLLRYERDELIVDPRSYLFKIAANVAWEWSMRAQQRLPHSAGWLEELIDEADVADETARAQRDADLDKALASLPTRAREVLRLHFREGLTRDAIAVRLNLTERIVKREIVNSYARLRMTLREADDGAVNADAPSASASGSRQ